MDRSIAANATVNRVAATVATLNARTRSSGSSTTGAGCLTDWNRNPRSSTNAVMKPPMVLGALQPQSLPLTKPSVRAAIEKVSKTAPRKSGHGPPSPWRTSGSTRQPVTMAAIPIGTLIRNTQRQLTWTRRPPSTGPRAAATPPTAPQIATARERCWAGVVVSSRASEVGIMIAAPAACTTLEPTNQAVLVDAAHDADPAVNTPTPIRNPDRWPLRSAMRPATTSNAAKTIA